MYDPVTLDQLRAFVTVVEEGSFSAAARKLRRVQSAISTSMANLEAQLGVPLWDRSTKVATLTEQGQAVLASTRRVLTEVDGLRRLTTGMTLGLEASVSLCLDAFFPVKALVDLCATFIREFPAVDLRIDTQLMSAVSARVLEGTATLGVVSPAGLARGLEAQALAPIRVLPVVSPRHPLAAIQGRIATRHFVEAIQVVLSDCDDDGVADQVGLSPRTWRVGDLYTKHEMLRAGLGWGNLPEHLVRDDLRSGALVPIRPMAWGDHENALNLLAVYRSDTVFGPAHHWLLEQLTQLCEREARRQK
ncbi:LysR family transcriptional regulator [Corallococcus llansteffanensis]|uniref:LysR family transcriptional regulator n=1 Tax=Corallococcus llansteffanensis TaxID=2316731 RepID=A0A3A8QFF8_9BACT|nr:LysR family transcriptional regulator [Corallococcus llansteffanensis]RKH61964.1 LysR family transcriptional regulator [Corallococcus llansteffanensis]